MLGDFDDQRMMFDQVTWSSMDAPQALPASFSAAPPAAGSSGFSFSALASEAVNGLRIDRLEFYAPEVPASGNGIFERIEFRDVAVEFADQPGTLVPFDFASATGFGLKIGRNGSCNGESNYPLGLSVSFGSNFGGRCPVVADFSLTLKSTTGNIDPGNNVVAVKVYPQVALRHFGARKQIKSLRATVWLLCSNDWNGPGMPGMPGMQRGTGNVASVFADTNQLVERKRTGNRATGSPLNWAETFDYHQPDLRTEKEFVGVYPIDRSNQLDANHKGSRKLLYRWPDPDTKTSVPTSSPPPGEVTLEKFMRQGAYDNIHLHSDMGVDGSGPADKRMVHAPGCAEACLHLHWRWGLLATFPGLGGGDAFEGWSVEPPSWMGRRLLFDNRGYRPRELAGGAMIPPNQKLTVALTGPDTVRASATTRGPVARQGASLPPVRKAIWYTVDAFEPEPLQWQVLLEMGASWAYAYNKSSFMNRLLALNTATNRPDLFPELEPLIRDYLKNGLERSVLPAWANAVWSAPISQWIEGAYTLSRWIPGARPPVCQIPEGGHAKAPDGSTQVKMEDL